MEEILFLWDQPVSNASKHVEADNSDVKKQDYLALADLLVVAGGSSTLSEDQGYKATVSSSTNTAVSQVLSIRAQVKTTPPSRTTRIRKVWIDLDNTPHVPFFAPIIEELRGRGCSVLLTARDAFQVYEMTKLFNLSCKKIGRHYGKNKVNKLAGLCLRAVELFPTVLSERPDLAVSHGSRAQLVASAILGVPSVCIVDYEFARIWTMIHPQWVMVPDVIPADSFKLEKSHVLQYPGIKEDVYVPRLKLDPTVRARLGLSEEDIVVTVRPPANEAHYHNYHSDELFDAVIDRLANSPGVRAVLLPRNQRQAISVRSTWRNLFETGKIIIPGDVLDGLNLIWHSDLVISGGGTMNREAAALGVPVYSIFSSKIGAVDRYLADRGRLVLIESLEDVLSKINLIRRQRPASPEASSKTTLQFIVDHIIAIMDTESKRGEKRGNLAPEPVSVKEGDIR